MTYPVKLCLAFPRNESWSPLCLGESSCLPKEADEWLNAPQTKAYKLRLRVSLFPQLDPLDLDPMHHLLVSSVAAEGRLGQKSVWARFPCRSLSVSGSGEVARFQVVRLVVFCLFILPFSHPSLLLYLLFFLFYLSSPH